LFVCLSVCQCSTGRIVTSIVSKLYQYIPSDPRTESSTFGRNRPKVNVKVTENVKNTFLTITFDSDVLETSSCHYWEAKIKPHIPDLKWPWKGQKRSRPLADLSRSNFKLWRIWSRFCRNVALIAISNCVKFE